MNKIIEKLNNVNILSIIINFLLNLKESFLKGFPIVIAIVIGLATIIGVGFFTLLLIVTKPIIAVVVFIIVISIVIGWSESQC